MRAKLFRAVPFARTGWQNYAGPEIDKHGRALVRVFRSAEEVRRSAPTFEGAPITVDHPPSLLSTDSAGEAAAGIVSGVVFDERSGQLRGDLLIWDAEAIRSVANGIRELSGGYAADYHERGQDFEQFNIRGNHVALVPKGRSGSAQRIGG